MTIENDLLYKWNKNDWKNYVSLYDSVFKRTCMTSNSTDFTFIYSNKDLYKI